MYEDIYENNPDTESRKEQANEYNKLESANRDTYQDEALHEALEDLANKLQDPEALSR